MVDKYRPEGAYPGLVSDWTVIKFPAGYVTRWVTKNKLDLQKSRGWQVVRPSVFGEDVLVAHQDRDNKADYILYNGHILCYMPQDWADARTAEVKGISDGAFDSNMKQTAEVIESLGSKTHGEIKVIDGGDK